MVLLLKHNKRLQKLETKDAGAGIAPATSVTAKVKNSKKRPQAEASSFDDLSSSSVKKNEFEIYDPKNYISDDSDNF